MAGNGKSYSREFRERAVVALVFEQEFADHQRWDRRREKCVTRSTGLSARSGLAAATATGDLAGQAVVDWRLGFGPLAKPLLDSGQSRESRR